MESPAKWGIAWYNQGSCPQIWQTPPDGVELLVNPLWPTLKFVNQQKAEKKQEVNALFNGNNAEDFTIND